jgi:hypothetical protein
MNSWYALRIFSHHLKLHGPMTLEALKKDLSEGKIAFSDFIYQPQDRRRWVRAFEIADLLSALPEAPDLHEFSEQEAKIGTLSRQPATPPGTPGSSDATMITNPAVMGEETKYLTSYGTEWCLQSEGIEYGPYTFVEIGAILKSGEFGSSVLLWHDQLNNWLKVENFEEFLEALASAIEESDEIISEKEANTRVWRRRILVASVTAKVGQSTAIGICWDISEGGLQAFRMDARFTKDSVYFLKVTPALATEVPAFNVHAKCVWINEVTKRVGFQFTDPAEKETVAAMLRQIDQGISKY